MSDTLSASDLPELWQQANDLQAQAHQQYPQMRCLSGCNDCCKHHGSPLMYPLEWDAIQSHLQGHPELLAAATERYYQLKQDLQTRLQDLSPPTIMEALFESACPFIEAHGTGERCSIYAVRPMTCRAFGNALLESQPVSSEQIYTCNPEKDRWEQDLPMLKELALPLRSQFFSELEKSGQRQSLLRFLERYLHESS